MSHKNLRAHTTEGNLSSAYGYFDKIQVWLKNPATRPQLAELAQLCGRGGIYAENRRARFSRQYRQRIELRQPNQEALAWLAKRSDALINRVEVALDLAFDNPADADDACDYFDRHLIRRWHGKEQAVFSVEKTRYDASRAAPNQIVVYPETYSRITGELSIVHLEWRANRARAVRSAGILTPKDISNFSQRKFWQRRLLLVDLDEERLGRYIRNTSNRTRSRKSPTVRYGNREVNLDRRLGHSLLSASSSIQEVVDRLRGFEVNRCFEVLSNEALLPGPERLRKHSETRRS